MELLVRVRWRHVPPADLRIDVEPYHTVGDLLGAASDFCDGNWDASQPVFLERSGDQVPLDVPIIESGIVSGDTLRFELYGRRPARPRIAVGGGELRRHGRPGGGPLVRAAARPARGRPGDGAAVRLDDVTVSDHQLAIIVYDDLVTRLVPDPIGDQPARRQRPSDLRAHPSSAPTTSSSSAPPPSPCACSAAPPTPNATSSARCRSGARRTSRWSSRSASSNRSATSRRSRSSAGSR